MRINTVFGDLKAAGLAEGERVRVQDLVRHIVTQRRKIPLDNDVAALYERREEVSAYLGVPGSVLDVLWTIPSIKAHLELCGYDLRPSTNMTLGCGLELSADSGFGTKATTAARDEVMVAVITDAVDRAVAEHTRLLRRHMYACGTAVMVLNGALVAGAVVLACSTSSDLVSPFFGFSSGLCTAGRDYANTLLGVASLLRDTCVGRVTEFLHARAQANAWFT